MLPTISLRRLVVTSAAATCISLFGNLGLEAQTPSPADYAAAAAATNVHRHALQARTPAGQAMSAAALSGPHNANAAMAGAAAAPDSGGTRFPADLTYNGAPSWCPWKTTRSTFIQMADAPLPGVGGIRNTFYATSSKAR